MIKKTPIILGCVLALGLISHTARAENYSWYDAKKYVQHLLPTDSDQQNAIMTQVKTTDEELNNKIKASLGDLEETRVVSGKDIIPEPDNN